MNTTTTTAFGEYMNGLQSQTEKHRKAKRRKKRKKGGSEVGR